ncbi:hypothetical protein EH240_17640 [Mesorhizobium tamadayense]|uniref:OmpR/PhoB-type domain-containing protein n=1 Tax=Mesorhizobium tamadayense TaxID=425306 RepID=A0A3P3FNH4_9HYPH|nr:winged helix-turn-helix domain-containing protein [Mesorhizobium tamadayense]RRI00160.1 hypothetical protein EH240_17640 [Mesorhizobium tamadayense]
MTTFEFSGHKLDLRKGRLRRGGHDVDLRAKSLSLLTYLLENAGRVIGKDELVNAVWPNIAVSDDPLTQCMKDVRKALGADAEGLIRTVLRRGYVIDEDRVRRIGDREVSATGAGPGAGDAPSIAVLPFENLSGDPAQDYFADGMVDEIITALSRMRWLFVIARNSSFAYKGQADGLKRAGAELGVRYLLTGSVRKAGDHIRLTGQLVDQSSGKTIWADRYDGTMADVFDLQDRLAENVVGVIQPSILSAQIERARRKRPESLAAYDYVLRAFPLAWSLERAQNEEAGTLLDRAIAIEPDYPWRFRCLPGAICSASPTTGPKRRPRLGTRACAWRRRGRRSPAMTRWSSRCSAPRTPSPVTTMLPTCIWRGRARSIRIRPGLGCAAPGLMSIASGPRRRSRSSGISND